MKRKGQTPPDHLSDAAKRWWKSVVTDYELEPHHLKLLALACESWDRTQQARAILDREGICVTDDRKNVRAHPAVAIEKDSRIAFARLVRELDLDTEGPSDARRPPPLRSNRG
ncbi:P27 family phage terminase small subunit [Rhizobiaceae bacterium n13]|uniref:P27 family phage terminase small subunit n=1 Tax=Ferirhizobium litorale TaxID=2927786 RepID=UPI0024B2FBA0|nr:P27 family phage terminase small subunit [Fererhizobium litorale]MDI7865050.1 P27 family phage terminase small subunit [Fererhizobium litorale]